MQKLITYGHVWAVMAHRANISFKDSDEDVYQFMEDMHENGPYRNRSHVVVEALKLLQEEHDEDEPLT